MRRRNTREKNKKGSGTPEEIPPDQGRETKKTGKRRKEWDPPDLFDPAIYVREKKPKPTLTEADLDANMTPQQKQEELVDVELKMDRIRYAVAIGRFKVSKKHSLKEYTV